MSDTTPLNLDVKITETSAYDCPHIFLFSYTKEEERKTLGYDVRRHPKTEAYLKRKDISPDLSIVKDEAGAQKLKKEFMEKYSVSDNVVEHVAAHEALLAESDRRLSLLSMANIVHYNNVWGINAGLSEPERIESFEYMKALLKAKSEKKNLDSVPMKKRPLLDSLGIKRDNLYTVMARTKESFASSQPKAEECVAILKALPEKIFADVDEGYSFPGKVSGFHDHDFNKKIHESLFTVAGDFLDIKIREDAERALSAKLKIHLKNLEKEKKLKEQLAARQTAKEKAATENKGKGAEAQEQAQKKRAAQDRLAEKGLAPKRGEKSGKNVHWGDSPALKLAMEKKKHAK